MSRTNNSIRNIKYAIVGQFIGIIVAFINRTIFIKMLSLEILGINGLFTNIISMISLAELGVGSAIIFSMYDPIANKDILKIKSLMDLYKKTYRYIGLIVLLIGTLMTPFIHVFFKQKIELNYINLIFLLFVINSASTYLFSYKRSLLIADQKKYINTIYRYSFFTILNILQILMLVLTKNYLIYIILLVTFTITENVIISKRIDIMYPYLKSAEKVEIDAMTKNTIIKNISAMVFHKLGGFIVLSTDNILLSKIIGIAAVGMYSNYYLIISSLLIMYNILFRSVTSSIGNLSIHASEDKIFKVFNMINFFAFWLFGFSSVLLLGLLNDFVKLWVGPKYLLANNIVVILILNFFVTGVRTSVLIFKDANGLYWNDRYKPIFESALNLLFSIILGYLYGMIGIFIGTLISSLSTCFWIEPFVLYKHVFKKSVKKYFIFYLRMVFKICFIGLITLSLSKYLIVHSFLKLIVKLFVEVIIFNVLFIILHLNNIEMKKIISMAKNKILKANI